MKLFRCTVEITQMVLAENAEEAKKIAVWATRDETLYEDDFQAIEENTRLCDGVWEADSLVYGNHKTDITLKQAWDMMKIPTPEEEMARMMARGTKPEGS